MDGLAMIALLFVIIILLRLLATREKFSCGCSNDDDTPIEEKNVEQDYNRNRPGIRYY
jgi:hypothetical protein